MIKRGYILSFLLVLCNSIAAEDFFSVPVSDFRVTNEGMPEFTIQIPADEITDGNSYRIYLEYPEYENLSGEEIRRIKKAGQAIADSIEVRSTLGICRKAKVLDVHFVPVIKNGNRWLRLVSGKLKIVPIQTSKARNTAVSLNSRQPKWKESSVLSAGKWVKIRVANEGIYELTREKLAELGFTDMSKVRLYGYGGLIQEENFKFNERGQVEDDLNEVPLYRRDHSVLFFAEGTIRWTWDSYYSKWQHRNNNYSRYSYYFLTEGEEPAQFEKITPASSPSKGFSYIWHHALLDDDAYSWFGGGSEMYDSYDFANGNTHTYRLATSGLYDQQDLKATVDISFAAASSSSKTDVSVALNNNKLGNFSIGIYDTETESGREVRKSYNLSVGSLQIDNAFRFMTGQSNSARLNYIRCTYPRKLDAKDAPYSFVPGTDNSVVELKISNATVNTRVWRLGECGSPISEIDGQISESATLSVCIEEPLRRYVIVDVAGRYPSPDIVGRVGNQNLHADGPADMVIIVPPSGKLTSEAERLAKAHRQKNGLRVRVVNAGQIYNEYSSGTPDASAYRRYMKMLYDRAGNQNDMPKYLLLFGDCAWDNRMLSNEWKAYSPDDFLLAYEVNAQYETNRTEVSFGTLYSYVTDDYFGLLDDGEGGNMEYEKIDLSIGRFPCHEPAVAKVLVDKTITYMENLHTGAWKNSIYVLGDYGDNNLHMNDADKVFNQIETSTRDKFIQRRMYWDAYPYTVTSTSKTFPQVSAKLRDAMKQGALLFNYSGHGSPEQLSKAVILKENDFSSISSGNKYALWVLASCEITPFDSQKNDIGRSAFYNPTGGAVGVVCASRSVYASYNNSLNVAYSKYLFGKDEKGMPYSIGDALRMAKMEMVSASKDVSINKLKYVLIGDPAVRLTAPTGNVVLERINGTELSAATRLQLKAGSVARFEGYIENGTGTSADTQFTGIVTASVFDRKETIVCKNSNNSESTKPEVYTERTKKIYEGSDSIRNGRFVLEIPIPRDISYTDDSGRITFYAVNKEHTLECHGYNEQFSLNGTDENAAPDNAGPEVYVYLDRPDFPDGGQTTTAPLFMADIEDDCGINAAGSSIGHDMELILDGNTSDIRKLNDYFTYDFGSYRKGTIAYKLTDLTPGKHTLSFKVWDVNNNSTVKALNFNVSTADLPEENSAYATENPARIQTKFITTFGNKEKIHSVTTEVYDISGRCVWQNPNSSDGNSGYSSVIWNLTDNTGNRLPAGIYLYRSRITSDSVTIETDAKKIIILKQ